MPISKAKAEKLIEELRDEERTLDSLCTYELTEENIAREKRLFKLKSLIQTLEEIIEGER